jgi:D-tyrosyl-tRNA(Tyr) deacylase
MIGLLQRVEQARVEVDHEVIGEIGAGLLVLACSEPGDSEATCDKLLARLLGYRVFPDAEGKMNRSLTDVGGGLLLVPQFTLAADTSSGLRPSFSSAAPPELAQRMFAYLVARARALHDSVAAGVFGAHMRVGSVNDGPVTFWIRVVAPS